MAATIPALVEAFVSTLRTLTADLVRRRPEDATIWRANRRILTGISVDPLAVVRAVGPYLFKYREQIYNFDEDVEAFFLENDYDDELMAGVERDKVDLAAYIIPVVKQIARDLPREDKQPYVDAVVELLDVYIELEVEIAERA
jgi:hypothetical protein